MLRLVVLLFGLSLTAITRASDVQTVLALWAAQKGTWSGFIDIYGPDSADPTRVKLETSWSAVPDASIVTKIETFISPTSENSAVTVMFAEPDSGNIVTPYFSGGTQRDYRFTVVSAEVTDATNWTVIIRSPDDQEVYEGRPAMLRYVRTRKGDRIENSKEVNFLDDNGEDTWELRSLIRQSLSVQ